MKAGVTDWTLSFTYKEMRHHFPRFFLTQWYVVEIQVRNSFKLLFAAQYSFVMLLLPGWGWTGPPAFQLGKRWCLCPMPSGHAEASGLVPPAQSSGGCTFFSFSITSPHAPRAQLALLLYSLSHKYPSSLPLGVLAWLPCKNLPSIYFMLFCYRPWWLSVLACCTPSEINELGLVTDVKSTQKIPFF